MKIRSSTSNQELLLVTDEPRNIFHYPKDTKSYSKSQGDMSKIDTPAGQSNQLRIVLDERENL